MSETALRRTPLCAAHERLKARMVPFAGWLMPVQYTGILEEARAVRTASGMFDISHMGRCMVHGPGAADLLQRLTTNDVSALEVGQAHYSLITNEAGGILDDIIIYRTSADAFRVVLNASNTERDLAWFRQACGSDAAVEDQTAETAMIAVQGPDAVGMVAFLCRANVETVPRLFKTVQPQDNYAWAAATLSNAKKLDPDALTKSGIMVGLGETMDEVKAVMRDQRSWGVDILTIGQYLQPSKKHLPMQRYYTMEEFAELRGYGKEIGFKWVESNPLVRSSYHAAEQVRALSVVHRKLYGENSGK